MKNCILEANKKFVKDVKTLFTLNIILFIGMIILLYTELVLIAEYLGSTFPHPTLFQGISIVLLLILFFVIQVVYAIYVHEICSREKP